MSIDHSNVVDIVSIDKSSGRVLLTISDHLPWTVNGGEHLALLQSKINSYLSYVESGELFAQYPAFKGHNITMNVVGLYPLSDEARRFYDLAKGVLVDAGLDLRFENKR